MEEMVKLVLKGKQGRKVKLATLALRVKRVNKVPREKRVLKVQLA